jgi:predicted porin
MQVKLIALAVAGLMAAPVFAQSNVTIYGRVDMGYQTLSNDGTGGTLDQESSNRWGIMGEEDLGGGLKAFFQLENRFYLDNGQFDGTVAASGANTEWKDKAWVGLSGGFGKVYLGRNASVGYALYGGGSAYAGGYEAFGGDTISSVGSRRARVVNIWDNSIRYDSPVFGGVQFIGTVSLNENANLTGTPPNDGEVAWGGGLKGGWGALRGELVYQHDVNNAGGGTLVQGNMFDTTYVTVGYSFSSLDIFGGYAWSQGYDSKGVQNGNADFDRWNIGMKLPLGNGGLLANIGWGGQANQANAESDYQHIGLGYWYSLSKRTILMVNTKYDNVTNTSAAGVETGGFNNGEDSQYGLQLAIRHSF